MKGLYRTFAGYATKYHSNGTGRDSYIMHDNGGLSKRSYLMAKKNIQVVTSQGYNSSSPQTSPRTWRYHSNGSGRDSYIYRSLEPLDKSFQISLRDNIRIRYTKTNDIFTMCQRRRQSTINPRIQKSLMKKLSAPTKITQKFDLGRA